MLKELKNKHILKEKPDIKLRPNHYHFISEHDKLWPSKIKGTAYMSFDLNNDDYVNSWEHKKEMEELVEVYINEIIKS